MKRRLTRHRWPVRLTVTRLAGQARTGLAAAIGLALVVSLAVVAVGQGYPATHPQMGTGDIWLPSNQEGELTLFDGSTLKSADEVKLAQPGTALLVAQAGDTGYVVDQAAGHVWRVNGTTLTASRPADDLIPAVGARGTGHLQVYATTAAFYAISDQSGLRAVAASPASLTVIETVHAPAATITADDTVVDQGGRLWVLDQRTGTLTWLSGGQRHVRPGVVAPGTAAVLAAADSEPVIVTPSQRSVQLLSSGSGAVQDSIQVPGLGSADAVIAVGAADSKQVLLADESQGVAFICSFTASQCARRVRLPYRGGAMLGSAVQAAGHAFIPDETSGSVIVIDLATGSAVSRPVFRHAAQFDLLAKDGVVFYNNPWTSDAGVIPLDGPPRAGRKYAPGTASPDTAPVSVPGGNAHTAPPRQSTPQPVARASAPTVVPTLSPVPSGTSATTPVGTSPIIPPPPTPSPTATHTIPPAPLVITAITVSPSDPLTNEAVTITVRFTGPAPASWQWTIAPASQQTPAAGRTTQATFTQPGTYTVTVQGGSKTKSVPLTIAAPNAKCGDTIQTNLKLNTDLTCNGNGLFLVRNVTLDLGGHTISGSGSTGISGAETDGQTIKNGTIKGFTSGFSVADGGSISLDNINFVDNSGVSVMRTGASFSDVNVSGGSFTCGPSASCTFTGGTMTNVQLGGGRTTIKMTGTTLSGTKVIAGTSGHLIFTDDVLTNGSNVWMLNMNSSATISGSTFSDDAIGINADLVGTSGVSLSITNNRFINDGTAGMLVTLAHGQIPNMTISGNTFTNNGHDAGGTKDLDGNLVADGLHIDMSVNISNPGAQISVSGNQTSDNAAYGIWATPGVAADGGGNTTSGNPDGCAGVSCQPA